MKLTYTLNCLLEAPSPEKDKKKRSRSKSPFSSWRKKKSPVADDEGSFFEKGSPTAASPDEEVQCEGLLGRKHEWESTTKKATSRSWDKIYIVLQGNKLFAYKDQRHYKQEPENYYRNEGPISLKEGIVQVASDYTKKKHVFRLKLVNGADYLFQAKDDDEMNAWLQKLQVAVTVEGSQDPPSRSQTLPAKGDSERKDEHKKRGFFTLKKK